MPQSDKNPFTPEKLSPGYAQTVVVIPAYNEARFIGSVVLQARRYAATVIVVDDGSQDGTANIAESAGATVLRLGKNIGKGKALDTGFRFVHEHTTAEVLVMLDGDGQHNCDEIPALSQPIWAGLADIVVGSRFLGQKTETPRWRIFGQKFLTLATNWGANSPLTDSQSGFRAFSRQVLDVFTFSSTDFSVESEMQFLIRSAGLRVVEVPITVAYKEPSKRNPVLHGLQVFGGIIRLVSLYRPLLFFGGGGLLLLTIGLLWGAYVIQIYMRVRTLAIGYALISVLLTIVGASSLFSGLLLYSLGGALREIKRAIEHLRR